MKKAVKAPPAPSAEEARRRGALGGKKSAEARKKRKALRELLEVALMMPADCGGTRIDSIVSALIGKAETGDTKAFEVIRDTLGEKPTEKLQQELTGANGGPIDNQLTIRLVRANRADS